MITARALSVTYPGKSEPALQVSELEIRRGEFVAIVGANGSGKSTLLKAIAGALDYSGDISVAGRDLRALSGPERARLIAYLPQSRPVPQITVRMLIAHGRFPHLGFSKTLQPRDEEIIERAAREAGVTDLLDSGVPDLSGGERQRAYLAMCLAQDAEVILLDEPTTFLDVQYQVELLEILARQNRGGAGKTIVLVSHDLPQAFTIASEIKLIARGTLAAQGAPSEIYSHPAIAQSFGAQLLPQPQPDALFKYYLGTSRS